MTEKHSDSCKAIVMGIDMARTMAVTNHGVISSGGGGYMPEPEINIATVCENQRVVDHNGDFIGHGKEAFDKLGIKHEH